MALRHAAAAVCAAGWVLAAPTFAHAASAALRWERIHVYHAEPSQVFARLGLTHITRYGHTLGQKRQPDPTFPPGLTDIVPFDPDHTLLVRGTTAGVAQFRQRVNAVDVPEPHWQITLTLLQPPADGSAAPPKALALQMQEITADTPLVVSFASDGTLPQYQLTVRVGAGGALTLTHRAALTIAAAPSDDPTVTPDVFVPSQVWTRAVTDPIPPSLLLTFSDRAADRTAAQQQIGQAAAVTPGDYLVQVQLTPVPAVTPPPVTAPPVISPAVTVPEGAAP